MIRWLWSKWGRLLRAVPGKSVFGTAWSWTGRNIGTIDLFVKVAVIITFIILMVVSCSGCSAAKAIAAEANKVRQNATDIRTEVVTAKDALQNGDVAVVEESLNEIDGKAVEIQGSVDKLQEKVTQVQDRVPYWMSLLKYGFITAIFGGVLFLMWRFNLFLLAEKVGQSIINLIAKGLGA